MAARKPRPDSRSLVMPPGRKIPRSPSPARPRPAPPPEVVEAHPELRKAAGELMALWAQIRACEACDRACPDRAYGTGFPRAPIMLLKERPSPHDLDSSNAFAAEADALNKAFDALEIPLSWLYGTTAVRCGSAPATEEQARACAEHLLVEIEAVKPRIIVVFGGSALRGLAALDGRCGLRVPAEKAPNGPQHIRSDLLLLVTEPLPEGVTQKDAKRRLWRDLQAIPAHLGR